MKKVLTIAGSDSCGGAGIQADIKTMTMNGVYAMSAVTALTAQNTIGVKDIVESSPEFLGKQLDSIFEDIFPDAVKVGMVASDALIDVIYDKLLCYRASNIVLDPVMVATSGAQLIGNAAIESLKAKLLRLATIITPNIYEAEILSGLTIRDSIDMEKAAQKLFECYGCATLVKGGHSINEANDVLFSAESNNPVWFKGKNIRNPNTHGTGCTLSSAIASNLAKGCSLSESVENAKNYLSEALSAMLNLGSGSGPLAHNYFLVEEM